ncbi:MAG: FlgD immunoglobulin-like domain containing protein, partial [Candidatus Zixiibacteriota bacterium]
ETTIQYELSASCEVRLDIYNLLGQSVRSLALGEQKMGRYSVRWDGKDDRGGDVASGIYIYRLEAFTNQRQDFVESKRMLLLR